MDERTTTALSELTHRLVRIESALDQLLKQNIIKEWYTTDEVAVIVNKAPFTVREWCRHGRIKASKRDCGRGSTKEWIVGHAELLRLQSEGLLPVENSYRHVR